MMPSINDHKNVISRLGGYHYEFEVGVLRCLDLFTEKAEKVSLELAFTDEDIFDDIKVYSESKIHHYQVKWGMKQKSNLKISQFLTKSGDLYLVDLVKTWSETNKHSTELENIFHIYTNKEIENGDKITTILSKVKPEEIIFAENKEYVFRLKSDIWDEPDFKHVRDALLEIEISKEVFESFLKSLMIETNQPRMPLSETEEKQFGNPIRNAIFQKIVNDLGLDKPPNKKTPNDVYSSIRRICEESTIRRLVLTKKNLAEKIGIKLEPDIITQEFPFNESEYVETSSKLQELIEKVLNSSEKMIAVIGKPGSGKSYLLTHWKNLQQNSENQPIWYYCFIKNIPDQNKRITRQQIIQNLISDIVRRYPVVGSVAGSLFASTIERLQKIVNKLGEYACSKNIVIPIIIDGLDHVFTTKETNLRKLGNVEDVIDFLNELIIPKGITIILGTQRGAHLEKIRRLESGSSVEIIGFSKEQSFEYLKRFGIEESAGIKKSIIESIVDKTNGLPLLLAYSVQANRNLTFDQRKKEFLEIDTRLEKTNGDVKIYYELLWKNIGKDPLATQYARLLSILDFPVSREFLENVLPAHERSYTSLDDCLKPLIPVITDTTSDISTFHYSFSKFIFNDEKFTQENKEHFYGNIFYYFKNKGLLENELGFKKAIEFAFFAKLYDEILQTISVDFTDRAILNMQSEADTYTNIEYAIKAAISKEDYSYLVSNCILYRYTKERFEFHLPLHEITTYLIKSKKPQLIIRLIFSNQSLKLDLSETLDLLSLCIDAGLSLPYREIMNQWRKQANQSEFRMKQIETVKDYAKVITHIFGFDNIESWVKKNIKDGHVLEYEIYQIMGKYAKFSEITHIIEKKNYTSKELVIILSNLLSLDKLSEIQEIFKKIDFRELKVSKTLFDLLLKAEIPRNIIAPFTKSFIPDRPSSHAYEKEEKELYELENSIIGLSYCNNDKELKRISDVIQSYPLTSVRLLQEMIFQLGYVKGRVLAKETKHYDVNILKNEISRFSKHKTAFGFEPSDENCTYLNKVAKYILSGLVEKYLELENEPDLVSLLESIEKLDNKFEWYTRSHGLHWIFISSTHVISCLDEIIKKYPSNVDLKNKVKAITEKFVIPDYTSSRVHHHLENAILFANCGMSSDAENEFEKSIISSFGYGYRKDSLLYDLIDIATCLDMVDLQSAEKRASQILQLSEFMWIVTDHSGTISVPNEMAEELVRIKSSASIALLKQFLSEKYELASEDMIKYAIDNLIDASINLRYNLFKKLTYTKNGYHDENWYLETYFNLAYQAISKNESELAIKILEEIRSFLINNLSYNEVRWERTFNKLAEKTGITPIDLSTKSKGDLFLDDFRDKKNEIILNGGDLNSVLNQFKQLGSEDRSRAIGSLVKFLIKNFEFFSVDDVDKIEKFYDELTPTYMTPVLLERKIALCYKNSNKTKYFQKMQNAFEFNNLGWLGYGSENHVNWLVEMHNNDERITTDFILNSFAEFTLKKYGPHGSIKRLSQYLLMIDDVDALKGLYAKMYEICKLFFRTYPFTDKFNWLSEDKFKTISNDAIINDMLFMA